ncbi:helix-turn-helix domain-containing protein [Rhodocytophaga aerolata]|uniref:Helix-turn-helix domain-containing protein n=1 Tax=Rhodocytophaga aerolata TaxID=455078 RepID=A0ABT8RF37_9BACT|nr:helix-turn-helix domain-containing protein [Rhodocytophaga aerolata]MDO1450712.1 helix-turn-helix domain-containing protein [Rhodocytophaga aerolata]
MNDFQELIRKEEEQQQRCPHSYVLALTDTMNVISGKWKLPIIASLLRGKNRFKDLLDNIEKITPRMLSKELKELEMNSIVVREVYDQTPVLITYQLTESGKSLANLIDTMINWGLTHRSNVL